VAAVTEPIFILFRSLVKDVSTITLLMHGNVTAVAEHNIVVLLVLTYETDTADCVVHFLKVYLLQPLLDLLVICLRDLYGFERLP